jgi:uncharacterized OsmC-like protein
MDTAEVTYTNELRTEALHPRSGQVIVTDAPVDNKGKGSAFSPTDLLATSLACCMETTIAIVVASKGFTVHGMKARVIKHMVSDPRRVAKVEVHLRVDPTGLGDKEKEIIERTAHTCPVALSLHPDLVQQISITYE